MAGIVLCIAFVVGMPLPIAAQIITTIAGNGTAGYSGDGYPATLAQLHTPSSLAVDGAGNVYVNDQLNNCVRRIDHANGTISTFAGCGIYGSGGNGGPATLAKLGENWGITFGTSGDLYITDQLNHQVRAVNTSGIITAFAGDGTYGYTGDGGSALVAELRNPIGIAVDASGNIYIGDPDTCVVRKVSPSGIITLFAGNGHYGYSGNGGPAITAQLSHIFGLATDLAGNVYIADAENNCIRMVNTSGIISTIAGTGVPGSEGDGLLATSAKLNQPTGVCVSKSGEILIADFENNRIRKVSPSGIISTVCGTGTPGFSGDGGLATAAELAHPVNITMDDSENIYIADLNNQRIRKIWAANALLFSHGHTQNLVLCENVTALSIDSLLMFLDHSIGRTDTLHLVSAPSHGSALISYTVTSTGSTSIPFGLSYTPQTGYSGNDMFRVFLSNGLATDTTTIYVTIEPLLADAGTISGPSHLCVDATISLASSVPGGIWSASNSTATITPITGAVTITGVNAGVDTFTYSLAYNCGIAKSLKTVTVNPLPDPGTIAGPTDICKGSTVNLTDAVPGGTWATSNSRATLSPDATGVVVTAMYPGTDLIYYTVSNSFCIATATHTIAIDTFPDPGNIIGPGDICIGATAVFQNTTPAGTWSGTDSTGSVSSGVLTGISAGNYVLSYTVANVCGTSTVTRAVTINSLPAQPAIAINGEILSTTPGYASYEWLFNNIPVTGATADTCTATTIGNYNVIVTNILGCSNSSDPVSYAGCNGDDISIYPNPTGDIIYVHWCKKITARLVCVDGKALNVINNADMIDISDLPNGVYILLIYDEQGNHVKTKKITKVAK